jgi:hypothetical protein
MNNIDPKQIIIRATQSIGEIFSLRKITERRELNTIEMADVDASKI